MSDERRASPSIQHVDSALKGTPDIEVVTAGEVLSCPGSPVEMAVFERGLDKALDHVLYQEQEELGQVLDRLDAMLPCLVEVLPRRELARISFLGGLGLAFRGEDEAAREGFRRALVVCPELEWDGRFPPKAKEVFQQAVLDALRSGSVPLSIERGVADHADLWIDGLAVAPGGSTSLAEGRHLVQWRVHDGGTSTRALVLGEGDGITVLGRTDVARAVVTGEGTAVAWERAESALAAVAASAGVDTVYLAHLGSDDLLHRFSPETGEWTITDAGLVHDRLQCRRLQEAGTASLIAGGALAALGLVVGIVGFTEASGLDDEADDFGSAEVYQRSAESYSSARSAAIFGFAIAGIGGGAVTVGIPLSAAGAKLRRDVRSARPYRGSPSVEAPDGE